MNNGKPKQKKKENSARGDIDRKENEKKKKKIVNKEEKSKEENEKNDTDCGERKNLDKGGVELGNDNEKSKVNKKQRSSIINNMTVTKIEKKRN